MACFLYTKGGVDLATRVNTPKQTGKEATSYTSMPVEKKINTPSGDKSVKEIRERLEFDDRMKEIFKATKDALALADLTKTETRTYTTYNKETLRQYLRNPKNYESNLRTLSSFLYRLCYNYRRLIWYNAEMVDLNAVSVIPIIENFDEVDDEQLKNNYYDTLKKLQQMNLANQILQLLIVAWREDTVYAYVYDDDETLFFHILDGNYCRVSSNDAGCLRFAFDFSYFRSHTNDLENWDSEFQKKYNAYTAGTANRWQELDLEKQICIKVNIDDKTMDYPPFAALFEQIIDLIDLQSIQAVKDELSIYKLLVARLQVLGNADTADQFEVDVDTAIDYYNRLASELPECVGAVLSPVPIDTIEFKGTTTEDTDSIANANKNLFKNATSSEVLYSEKSNSAICNAQLISDTLNAIGTVLPQIERWINCYLTYKIGDGHAYVKCMMVSPYTKSDYKKSLLESGQNGLPFKLEVGGLDGFTPLETLSKLYLENNVLDITNKLIPFSTSYTKTDKQQNGDGSDGAPLKDDADITDSGLTGREYK